MPNWCSNRVEISCSSIHKEAIVNFAKGAIDPYFSKAVLASIKLFLAGCAGILKPVDPVDYRPYPDLLKHGIGETTERNIAYQEWLELLIANSELTEDTCARIISVYEKTGLPAIDWRMLNAEQQAAIGALLDQKHFDWLEFRMEPVTHEALWKELSVTPDQCRPFDMRYLIPSRLACEINGFNGKLLDGVTNSYDLYCHLYGVKWPVGYSISVEEANENLLIVDFDTPWAPPDVEVFKRLSDLYQCRIDHYYSELGACYCGHSEYQKGKIVDALAGDLVFGEPDEDGFNAVTGPEYILGNVRDYGG